MKRDQLTDLLRQRIASGQYTKGSFLPSERILAVELGVSRPTLRRALEPLVNEGLLQNHPGMGTSIAGDDAERPWKILALLLPDITNRFFSEVTEAIEYTALQRGYQLLLCNSRHQIHLEEFHIRQLADRRVDGVVLAHDPYLDMPASIQLLEQAGIATVLLFSSPHHANYDSVILDDRAGVEQGMRYLRSLGHRRIAFCRPVPGARPHPREIEYREQMHADHAEARVLELLGIDDGEAQRILAELLASRHAPTAFFAGNDHMAVLLMKHFAALGIDVPGQVSVLGFDNLRVSENLPIPLTTIDQPKQQMGRRAVELLFERMDQPSLAVRREVFAPHLIIRNSCGVAAARRAARTVQG